MPQRPDDGLPLLVRRTVSPSSVQTTHHVSCALQGRTVTTDLCDVCPERRGARRDDKSGAPVVHCTAEGMPTPEGLVSLLGATTESVTVDVRAADALAHTRQASLVVVDRAGRPLGAVDRGALELAGPGALVADRMSPAPAALSDGETVEGAARRMIDAGATRVPVVSREGALIGVVSALDVLGFVMRPPAARRDGPAPQADAGRGARVVLLSADATLVDAARDRLRELGMTVDTAANASAALTLVRRQPPHVIVLDARLPGATTGELIRRLKTMPGVEEAGLMVVATEGDEVDRIVGLELGADDYLATQPGPRELALRVRALAHRASGPAPTASPTTGGGDPGRALEWRGLKLDPVRQRCTADGQPLSLRRMEYQVLALLMERPARVLSRKALCAELWPDNEEIAPRTIDTHVRRLRAALGPYRDAIETVHGFGYRLREP